MADQPRNVSIKPQQRIFLAELSWENINEPGAYVEVGPGDLYRIPQEALLTRGSPLIRKESMGASRVVRVSKDPYITTLEARRTIFIQTSKNRSPISRACYFLRYFKRIREVAMIIRAYGYFTSETFLGTPWEEFLTDINIWPSG